MQTVIHECPLDHVTDNSLPLLYNYSPVNSSSFEWGFQLYYPLINFSLSIPFQLFVNSVRFIKSTHQVDHKKSVMTLTWVGDWEPLHSVSFDTLETNYYGRAFGAPFQKITQKVTNQQYIDNLSVTLVLKIIRKRARCVQFVSESNQHGMQEFSNG